MSQLQVTGEAKIRDIQGPVVANSGVITALDGAASQYVRGDGTLADFPTSSGGGSSVSYYLNSSVSQGTIGGVAYRELSKEPIIGAGTDIVISANGYVASYLTDANDPDVILIPGGNFNCEFYFSVNNNTGNPFFYAELYKYDGTTFTLLGSSVGVPEYITQGTVINPYYFAIPVATATLALTDRLAIRIYVNVDGRTVTLHTENGHLCQVVTTLSKGMVSLNNLTDQSQFLTTGTSGTNFAIVSSGDTHTFNLPVASATNTGKLSSTDWTTFNNKQNALTNPITGTGTSGQVAYFNGTSSLTSNAAFAFTPTSQLLVNNSVTAASAIARGTNLTPTLTAAANNDVLVGLDINPTFNTGAFTNVGFYALRVNGVVSLYDSAGATQIRIIGPSGSNKSLFFGNSSAFSAFQNVRLYNQATTNLFVIATGDGTANPTDRFFITQGGNVGINTSGTDAGFRLDVNGTARVQSTLSVPVTSSASITNASIATLAAGYSGSARTDAFIATNSAAGTGTNLGIPALNSGGSFAAIATTTGYNTGLRGIAFGSSSINMGFYGDATTGTSGNNIGAFGRANNSGAGMYVGGYFSNSITTTFPTISANAALIADNGTTSSDIFIAQVNGSAVLNIKSTGQLNTTGSITAASAIARGVFFNNTLVAAANSDVLVGLDINPTFTNGAFTGVTNYALRSQGRVFINPTIATTNSLLRITDNTNGTAWMGFSSVVATGFFIGTNGSVTIGQGVSGDNAAPTGSQINIRATTGSRMVLNTNSANEGIQFSDGSNATIRMNFPSAGEAAITTLSTHNLSIGTAASTTAAVTNTIKFFGSSNNVGINQTTDAGFRLDVNGTSRVTGAATFSSSVTATSFEVGNGQYFKARRASGNLLLDLLGIESGTDNTRLLITGDFNVKDGSLSTLFTITSGGNVGIGTSSPNSLNSGANQLVVGNGSSTQGITIFTGSTSDGNIYFANGTSGSQVFNGAIGYNHNSNYMFFATNGGGERMRIYPEGQIGIKGAATTEAAYALFTNDANTGFFNIFAGGSGTATKGLKFKVTTGSSTLDAMTITSGGNVLIGTTTDNGQGKLQVNGAITATNISYTGELVTTSTTFNATYYHIISGAVGSGQTYTLPSPSSNNLQYVVINKSNFSQTISAGSGFTIYNMAGSDVGSITLASKARCFIIADGSGFYQIF